MREAIGSNIKKLAGFSFYHPIASVITSVIEKKITFITRGLHEVRNLQAENFVAEKFALTTYSRLAEGFARDFLFLQTDCTLLIAGNPQIMEGKLKVYESKNPPKYRLIFNPIDNITNFARGFNDCGCSFTLQSIVAENKFEDIFCFFYSFKTLKFLYSEYKGITYIENKRMKAIYRKTSLVLSLNTERLTNENLSEKLKTTKIKQIICRDSFVSDFIDIANGSLDGVVYKNVPVYNAISIGILCNSLALFTNGFEKTLASKNLTDEIDIIAGAEILPNLLV